MKQVTYKGSVLARNSTAYELWENWQSEKKDRNAAQKKLDNHMKDIDKKAEEMRGGPMASHLVNFAIGNKND